MTKVYRIYTEDVNRSGILGIVSNVFDGFTVFQTFGYWKGNRESSLVIEIVGDSSDKSKIRKIAKAIRLVNRQDSVLVQEVSASSNLITKFS